MKKKFRYDNILQTSTLQFDGHIRDHFVENARRVVAFYILPRGGKEKNFTEVYERGKLRERKTLYSPKNIIAAYPTYYFQYLEIVFRYFPKKEKVVFINHIPLFFFFNSVIRLIRPMEIIYWITDYWSMDAVIIRIFRMFMNYYHKRTRHTLYITDRVNRRMNGKVLRQENKKTVMLGIDPSKAPFRQKPRKLLTLCFIGVLVGAQGVDLLLHVVTENKDVKLKLIGTGEEAIVAKYKKLIERYRIGDRVFFPNRFYYGEELKRVVSDCHVGVALYTIDPNTVTYFADPAKIKQYAEFGLPIIMTKAAEVADYIKRFNAGIVVERNLEAVSRAMKDMEDNYSSYLAGLRKFNEYFNYKTYYKKAFRFLEGVRG